MALAAAAEPEKLWQIDDVLIAPESVCLDEKSGSLFISQLGEGGGKTKDGDGRISKVTLDGKVESLDWVTGLDAPKGMAIHAGILWVSDIDQLVEIEIETAEIVKRIKVDGSEMLNDVACGPDGTVYFTDFFGGRILKLSDTGKPEVLHTGKPMELPNGVTVVGDKLYIATWGSELADDFTTKTAGQVFIMDLATEKIEPFTKQPTGNLDGIEAAPGGGFYITDWIAGKVLKIDAAGKAETILDREQGTADLEFSSERKMLFLPEMLENRVVAFKLLESG